MEESPVRSSVNYQEMLLEIKRHVDPAKEDHSTFVDLISYINDCGGSAFDYLNSGEQRQHLNCIDNLFEEVSSFGHEFRTIWFQMLPEGIRNKVDLASIYSRVKDFKIKSQLKNLLTKPKPKQTSLPVPNSPRQAFFTSRKERSKSFSPGSLKEAIIDWKRNISEKKEKKEKKKSPKKKLTSTKRKM